MTRKNYSCNFRGIFRGLFSLLLIFGLWTSNSFGVTATVGTAGGTYPTLSAAFADINAGAGGLTGAIILNVVDNTTEPAGGAILNASGVGGASYTSILVQPFGGAARTISGAATAGLPLIDLNGADNVTFDGLNTGGNSLTIANTTVSTTSGTSTIRFQADATGNTITNCAIQGSATMAVGTNGGNIWFGAGSVTTGNDGNIISNCDLGPAGANIPSKAIYANGTTTTATLYNSGIQITGCNIHDFFSATVQSAGIYMAGGNTGWTISNNKFYQSATRTQTTGTIHACIQAAGATGNDGHTISGNTIGYASSAGTGTYTFAGIAASRFYPIYYSAAGTVAASSIQGNTITALNVSGAISGGGPSAPFGGILCINGIVNIGNVTANTIGSSTIPGAITLSSSSALLSDVYGIYYSLNQPVNLSNNIVGGISASNSSTGAIVFYGIRATTGSGVTNVIQNNTIGYAAAPISCSVASTSTTSRAIGLTCETGAANVTSNIIRNITMNSANIGTGTLASLIGILISNGTATIGNTVGQNQVYALTNSSSAASLRISGIVYSGATTGIHVVERNLVYDLDAGGAATTLINAIDMAAGTTTYKNNMIRLGTFGTSASTGMALQAFNENAGTPTNNIIFNSVYIGGNPTTGTGNSFGLNNAITPTSARIIKNNIFYNGRSSTGTASGKNYAIRLGSTTNTTIDNNDYYANGTLGVLGLFNGVDKPLLADWKSATAQDLNSQNVDPVFNNPTGAGSSVNLHITTGSTPNSMESAGATGTGVTTDYENETRPGPSGSVNGGATAPDIGADEFDGFPADVTPPTIIYTTPIPIYTCSAITLSASITDLNGIPQSAPGLPVVWWKIGVGGTYTPATGTWTNGSNYNFTFGSGATAGQTIYFYLVARDNSSSQNIAVLPSAGASGPSTVDPISVSTPPTSPNSYLFSGILSGTKTIGSSGDYPTIGDAINAYNSSCLGGALIFELIDNSYSEVNAVTINNHIDASALNTLTIRPASSISSPVIFTTANGTANFDLNGAKYVTIDGRPGGAGTNKYLIIENTSTLAGSAGNAILIRNEASYNTVTYCEVRSANANVPTSTAITTPGSIPGAIAIGTTTGSFGNDNDTISFCNIHSLSSGGNLGACIYSGNATTAGSAANNDNNTIDSCNIYDFYLAASNSAGIDVSIGNNSWTITNNRVFQTGSRDYGAGTPTVRGFWITPNTASLTSASGFVVSGNYLGGSASNSTGVYTMTGTAAWFFNGMDISVGTGAATSMQANTIANINMTTANASTTSFVGYNITRGNVNVGTVTGNLFGSTTSTTGSHSITFTTAVTLGGLAPFRSVAGGTINFANNTAAGIDLFASATNIAPSFTGISVAGGTTINVTNDTIGSATVPNSINLVSTSATSTSATVCRGIVVSAGTTTTVSGNLIANINSNYSATGTQLNSLGGITVSASTSSVTGNTIRNLTSATQTTGSGASSAIVGIAQTTTSAGITVSRNTIHSLRLINSGLAAGAQITGIFIAGPTTGTNVVSRNNIHSLSLASSTNTASTFTGITVSTGTTNYTNNMIRLGYDESGNEITAGVQLRGISKGAPNANNFYHNSIFIGGTNVISSALNSFAFQRSIPPSGTNDDIRDNIFVNNRSNATTGGKHYVFSASQNTFLTLNNNVYYFNGTGGVFALNLTTDVPSYITNWLAGDANSYTIDPLFINPTGSATTVNLHIDPVNPTVVESSGTPIAAVTDDFDGQTRASLTPTDIGADAADFVNLVCNGIPPSGTAIYSGSTDNICVSGTKTLTLSNFPSTPGLTLQWQESATQGGPYTNVTGGSGATTLTFTTPTITQTMYYICLVTCINGGLSTPSSEKAVVVDNPQVLTTTPATTCGPGTVTLSATASAGASISWFTALTGGSALNSFPYLNIPVTGFNNDVVANGVGDGTNGTTLNTSSTGNMNGMVTQPGVGMDGAGNTFIDGTYKWYTGSTLPACFLPASGQIPSALTSGLTYQLNSYSGLNALTIESNTYGGSVWPTVGTVTLATPASYSTLKVLYETVQNTAGPTITATLTFTDATTQVITGNTFVNWLTATGVAYTPHISRAQNVAPGNPGACNIGPYLFEMTLPVSAANYNKLIQSITFNFSLTSGSSATTVDYLHVLALGGVIPPFMNSYTTPVIFAATPYYVQASIGSCNSTPRTLVNANYTTPPALTLTSNQDVCVNMIAPISVTSNLSNFSSYTWAPITNLYSDAAATIPLTALDNLTTVYFKSSTVGSNSITVTATGGGCANIVTTSVSTIAGPAVTITTTPNAVCPGGNIQLNAVAAGTNTYSWAANPTLSATNISNPIAQNIQSTQTYSVTVTAASGCSTTQTVNAVVNPAPDPLASSNAPVCEGFPLTLFGINNDGTQTNTSWSWSGPSYSATSQNPSISGAATTANAGTYYLTITNSLGCTASSSVQVTVNPNPVLVIGSQTNVSCNGETDGEVDIDATSGTSPFVFDLDGNPTLDGIYTGLGAGTYTANCIDDAGCEATSIIVTITEPDVLTVTAGSNTPVCAGTSLNLTSTPVGGTTAYGYAWTGPNGAVPAVQNPTIASATAADAGQYNLTITDANGCTATASHTVFIYTASTAPTSVTSDDPDNEICSGQNVLLTANGGAFGDAPGASYKWYEGGCGTGSVLGSASTLNVINPAAGSHTYYVRIEDGCGNTSCSSITILVTNAPPGIVTGTFTGPSYACSGTVSLITVNPVSGSNIHYSWNIGTNSSVVLFSTNIGGPFSAGPFSTPTNQVYAQFGALGAGHSGYYVCVQGVNSCGSTTNRCLSIRGTVSGPGLIAPADPLACPNDVKNYTCGASAGATVYNWTLSGSATPITSGQGTTAVTVTFPPAFTTGQLCVTAALACGGSSTSPPRCMTISTNPASPSAITGPVKVCPGATGVPFSVSLVTGATGYNWTVPSGCTIATGSGSNAITVNFPNPYTGAPSICVTATGACGTSVQRCKTVGTNIPSMPGNITGPNSNICNSTVQYSIANVSGATGYTWTSPAGTTISNGQGSTTILLSIGSAFTTGTLSVTANTSLCTPGISTARTITIVGKPSTPGTITASPGVWCAGGFVNFSIAAASPLPTYTWFVATGTIDAGQGSNNIDVTWGSGAGNVNVTASNSCGASGTRSQSFSSSCREEEELSTTDNTDNFAVYPNPAHDHVTVSIYVKEAAQFNIKLRDLSGRIILSEDRNGSAGLNTYDMELKNFAKGLYMLDVQSADKNWKSKVVIQ